MTSQARLTIVHINYVARGLDIIERDVGKITAIVSVGEIPSTYHSIPYRFVDSGNRQQAAEAFSLAHNTWNEDGVVLFHCYSSTSRSPTFASFCLADYYGPGREKEALQQVRTATKGGYEKPDAGVVECALPLIKDDGVAASLIDTFYKSPWSMFEASERRRWVKQGLERDFEATWLELMFGRRPGTVQNEVFQRYEAFLNAFIQRDASPERRQQAEEARLFHEQETGFKLTLT